MQLNLRCLPLLANIEIKVSGKQFCYTAKLYKLIKWQLLPAPENFNCYFFQYFIIKFLSRNK